VVRFGNGYIVGGHYYDADNIERWEAFWEMCYNNDKSLRAAQKKGKWEQMAKEDAEYDRQAAAGKRWLHKCPKCGKTFENDDPVANQFCYDCGREILRRVVEEWEDAKEL